MVARRSATAGAVVMSMALLVGGCATGVAPVHVGGAAYPPPSQAAPGTTKTSAPSPATVTVVGRAVPLADAATVGAALAAAHVRVPAGELLAVSSRRVLGQDGLRGRVLVDGRLASTTDPLGSGDVVTVVRGPDRIEPTRPTVISLPPPNPSNLYVGGTPGRAQAVVGLRSGEVVVKRVVREPVIGHLVVPGAVALTFDDGPDPSWTPQVLALLAKAHVHATFCLIGRNAAMYPQLVRDIVAAGHTLCDHTWDHDEELRIRPAGQIALDISRGAAAIKAAAGVMPAFFRAPGGNWSPAIEAEAERQHMTPLKWTVDPRDWSRPGVASILATVYREVRPGGVILMHDGGGDRSESVAALKILLVRLPAMGYHFVVPPPPGASAA